MQQHYEAAERYEAAGDQDQAAGEYRAFLGEALHRAANGRAGMADFTAAFPLFEQALAFAPRDSNLHLDYARASLSADQLVKAKEMAGKALELAPHDASAHLLLGRIFFHLEDYPAAATQLETALAANADFETGYLLGRTYLLLKDEKRASVLFAEMVSGLGDTVVLHIYLGRAYHANDYEEQAVAEYNKALAKDPRAPGAHYYLALTYLGHNEQAGYAKAVPEFRAELQNHPDDFPSHYMLGYIAFQKGEMALAEAELSRAVMLRPRDANSLLYLAKVYQQIGHPAESEAMLRQAIAVNDPSLESRASVVRAHYVLGQLLQRTGRHEEGRKELQAFAVMDKQLRANGGVTAETRSVSAGNLARADTQPFDTIPQRASEEETAQFEAFVKRLSPAIASAYNSLGAFAAGHRDFGEAMEYFQSAKTWDPSLEGLDRNLGLVAFYAGQYAQAALSLERFLGSRPNDGLARSTLGLSFFQLGNFPAVVATLGPVTAMVDSDPRLSYIYAVSLVKTGKPEAGIERLKALEKASPNSSEIQAALAEALAAPRNDHVTSTGSH
jgi:tetratricopeptide (TPR) repeat protein